MIDSVVKSISFSSLSNHKNCSWFYKLKYIDKVGREPNTIWTHYGTLLHTWVQTVLEDPNLDIEIARKKFITIWYRFCRLYKKQLVNQVPEGVNPFDFYKGGSVAIRTIREEFKKQFGQYKIINIEEYFRLPASEKWSQDFGGLIDISVELKDGTIVIADFKTCNSHFMFNKYRDKYKNYQIILYKEFFAKKHNIDRKRIKTQFITIERIPKSKNPIQFTTITSGPKRIKNALKWMTDALSAINREIFIKNKSYCHAYNKECIFLNTPHCK